MSIKRLTPSILLSIIFIIAAFDISKAQSEWSSLPPDKPANIWLYDEATHKLVEIPNTISDMPTFNEMTLVTLTLENIVIYNKKEWGSKAEVATIARRSEGPAGLTEPMLVGTTQSSEKQSSIIKFPLIGPRFWTNVPNYDLRLEMWEVDSNKVSGEIGGQTFNYANAKTTMRALSGSLTSAVVTPHETAILAIVQPLVRAIVKHFEQPDKLYSVRFSVTTSNRKDPSSVPLKPGIYIVEYASIDPKRKRLGAGIELNPNDYTLKTEPRGDGKSPNYVVIKVGILDAESTPGREQDARLALATQRDAIRNNYGHLLPSTLRSVFSNNADAIDQLTSQLEFSDLIKRYNIRLNRSNLSNANDSTAKTPQESMDWFVTQVEKDRITNLTRPVFTPTQLQEAVRFLASINEDAPVLDTDNPEEVFKLWAAYIHSQSAPEGQPKREFQYTAGGKFSVKSGFDEWYLNRLITRLGVISNSGTSDAKGKVNDYKLALVEYLNAIDEANLSRKLSQKERESMLTNFTRLFSSATSTGESLLTPPQAQGSASARAETYKAWLNDPQIFIKISESSVVANQTNPLPAATGTRPVVSSTPTATGTRPVASSTPTPVTPARATQRVNVTLDKNMRLEAQTWTDHLLDVANKELNDLYDAAAEATPVANLYEKVLAPVLAALDDTNDSVDKRYASTQSKSLIARWLKDHTTTDLKTSAPAWKAYFGKSSGGRLYINKVLGINRVVRQDPYYLASKAVEKVVKELREGYDSDAEQDYKLEGKVLRDKLMEAVRFIDEKLTKEEQRLLLDRIEELGKPWESKEELVRFINDYDSRTNTYFVVFEKGILSSSRAEYNDPTSIRAALAEFDSLKTEYERRDLLKRAINYITMEGSDEEARADIYDMLTGQSGRFAGITDFRGNTSTRYDPKTWRTWLIDYDPKWQTEAKRFVRSVTVTQPIA